MTEKNKDWIGVTSLGVLVLGGCAGAALLMLAPVPAFISEAFGETSPYGALYQGDITAVIRLFSLICLGTGLFAVLSLAYPEWVWIRVERAKARAQSLLTGKRAVVLIAVILVLFSALIYTGAFRIGFHSDDFAWIDSTAKTAQDPGHMFSLSQSHFFRPLTFIYHTVNYTLFRNNPHALHIAGILLHGLAALFIFLIALELSDRVSLAITASLLFCAYPVSNRSVMWISGSEIVFAGLIYLVSFYLFLLHLKKGKFVAYVFSFLLFILGLMAKEAVISLAAAVLLAGILISKREFRWRSLPFILVAVAFLILQTIIQTDSFLLETQVYSLKPAIVIGNYGGYALASLIPLGHRILHLYPFLKWVSLAALAVFISAVLIAGSNRLKFLTLWFVCLLAPFMAFNLPVQPRYLYLPSFALCLLFAWILSAFYRKAFAISAYRKLAFIAGLCLLIGLSLVQIHTASIKMKYESKRMNDYIEKVKSDPQRMREIRDGRLPTDSPLTYDHLKAALNL